MMKIHFEHIYVLLLVLLVPVYIVFRASVQRKTSVAHPLLQFRKISPLRRFIPVSGLIFETVIILLTIAALANPVASASFDRIGEEGIDIVFLLDISLSMQAGDIEPTRLDALKEITKEFLKKTVSDRVGIVVFAGDTFIQTPLTDDSEIVINLVDGISAQSINQYTSGGTAVGNALLQATEILRRFRMEKRDQVIILISDGESNLGIAPLTALKYMISHDIRLYCIGVGSDVPARVYLNGITLKNEDGSDYMAGFNGDELKSLAGNSGGLYFRAGDSNAVRNIFENIQRLEKTPLKNTSVTYNTSYRPLVSIVLFVFFCLYIVTEGIFIRRPFR